MERRSHCHLLAGLMLSTCTLLRLPAQDSMVSPSFHSNRHHCTTRLFAECAGDDFPRNTTPRGSEGKELEAESDPCCETLLPSEDVQQSLLPWLPHGQDAITAEAIYTGEVLSNTRGGLNTNRATRYRGMFEIVLNADLESLFGLQGMSLFVNAGNVHGQPISIPDVGDWQFVSNIDSSPKTQFTQLNEYWLRQQLSDTVWFKFGRIDANADFGFADLAGDFSNASFGQMPTVALPVWPFQSFGATGFINMTDDLLLAAGTYQGNKLGSTWGIPVGGKTGYVTMGHLEWKTASGPDELPGTWRLGSWYQSGDWNEITTAPIGEVFSFNYGFWATADQMLFKEESSGDIGQGLGTFFEYGWSPEDRNFLRQSFGAGLVYRGLIDRRDDDVLGIGLARVEFGTPTKAVNGFTWENTWELFYKYQARPYFSIQPDLQYVANPGGNGRDAVVTGLRFEVAL